MSLADVLVGVLGQQGEVPRWNHLPEDRLRPLFSCLVLVLDLEVLGDEARRCLHDLNDLVLQN